MKVKKIYQVVEVFRKYTVPVSEPFDTYEEAENFLNNYEEKYKNKLSIATYNIKFDE